MTQPSQIQQQWWKEAVVYQVLTSQMPHTDMTDTLVDLSSVIPIHWERQRARMGRHPWRHLEVGLFEASRRSAVHQCSTKQTDLQ